jgi:predicted acylesterase/phospholipase RssA
LFRLLERGGFWTGNVVVSLLEKHLQAKISVIKRPTGPNGTVAFQDLPIDFCCTATDVGRLPDSSVGAFDTVYVNQSQSQIVYFSKKTSPTYSVAEAVRRSVSLPIVFYPLKINEGNGMNFPSSNRIFYHLDRKKFLIDPANINRLKNQKAYDMSVHNNHILLDGGFRVNLPVGVMRDPDNVVFDNNLNADGSPRNFLFAFNLTDLDTLPQRPDGIPLKSDPEPLPSILSTINDMIEGVFSGENSPVNNAINTDGLKRVKKALAQTMDYAAGSRQEQEIIDLLALVPKVIPVNIPSKDPSIDNGDDRFSGEAFGMPNLEKKWIAGSAWNAMNEALSNLKINNFPLGVASNIRPYEHGLIINLQTPNAGSLQFKSVSLPRFGGGAGIPLPLPQNQIQDSPATINDTYYSDENFKFSIPPGLINPLSNILGRISDYHFEGNQKSRYVGPGTYWIKTKNSDKTNSADNYLMFDVNNPVRVYLIIDIIYKQNHNSLPAFLRDKSWKDTGIELSSNDRAVSGPPVTGSSAVGSGQNNSMNLFVMQKDFEIGTITLGGMRSGGGKDNRCNYSVLVVQRD